MADRAVEPARRGRGRAAVLPRLLLPEREAQAEAAVPAGSSGEGEAALHPRREEAVVPGAAEVGGERQALRREPPQQCLAGFAASYNLRQLFLSRVTFHFLQLLIVTGVLYSFGLIVNARCWDESKSYSIGTDECLGTVA